jgi:hypothetical protein
LIPTRPDNSLAELIHLQGSQMFNDSQNRALIDAASPNWHFIIAMRPKCPPAVDDLVKHFAWKNAIVILRKQS